jgi:RNA polymerase sigma factor (TIGR02999 family)
MVAAGMKLWNRQLRPVDWLQVMRIPPPRPQSFPVIARNPAMPAPSRQPEHARAADDGLAAVTEGFYAELRGIAQRAFASERSGHTLQPTAVVNEACLRMMSHGLPDVPREQRLALAGRVLRQVLVDHARARNAEKRGGREAASMRLDLDRDILAAEPTLVDFNAVQGALERLRQLSERQAEVVTLRIFAGLTMEQIATVLATSKRTVEGDWTVARAWLRRELAGAADERRGA